VLERPFAAEDAAAAILAQLGVRVQNLTLAQDRIDAQRMIITRYMTLMIT
jgi:hypothetical protein